ncbi:DUF6126 family protein [Streptomyces sp. NPDC090131]|uniref:DUF6126 family protein n=1 Tax=Streptomyces sp. NPDC090131 TaxID=3365954 RepID=UPI003808AE0F
MSQTENPATTTETTATMTGTTTTGTTTPTAGTAPTDAGAPTTIRARFESKFPRGLIIRLIAYLFVGHLFAFFVYLLFVLGGQNQ